VVVGDGRVLFPFLFCFLLSALLWLETMLPTGRLAFFSNLNNKEIPKWMFIQDLTSWPLHSGQVFLSLSF
jgi:hypothetical protein